MRRRLVRWLLVKLGAELQPVESCDHINLDGSHRFTMIGTRGPRDIELFMCTRCGLIEGEQYR